MPEALAGSLTITRLARKSVTSRTIDASLYASLIMKAKHRRIPLSDYKQLSRSVRGLTVLVTGAASGMGRATARVFGEEGANVAVTDLSPEGTSAVADAITANGGKARAWTLDVADPERIRTVVNEVAAHFGGLDIIVNLSLIHI